MGGFGSFDKFKTAVGPIRRTINVHLRFDMSVEYLNLDQELDPLRRHSLYQPRKS